MASPTETGDDENEGGLAELLDGLSAKELKTIEDLARHFRKRKEQVYDPKAQRKFVDNYHEMFTEPSRFELSPQVCNRIGDSDKAKRLKSALIGAMPRMFNYAPPIGWTISGSFPPSLVASLFIDDAPEFGFSLASTLEDIKPKTPGLVVFTPHKGLVSDKKMEKKILSGFFGDTTIDEYGNPMRRLESESFGYFPHLGGIRTVTNRSLPTQIIEDIYRNEGFDISYVADFGSDSRCYRWEFGGARIPSSVRKINVENKEVVFPFEPDHLVDVYSFSGWTSELAKK